MCALNEATACALVSFADSRLRLQQLPAPVYRRAHALSELAGARGQGGRLSLMCGEITEQEKRKKILFPACPQESTCHTRYRTKHKQTRKGLKETLV